MDPTTERWKLPASAALLNSGCYCRTLDPEALKRGLASEADADPILAVLAERPTLFASTAVFLKHEALTSIESCVSVIERIARSPQYQKQALERAPPIAHLDFGPRGVFMSYDFHLGTSGPRLIEINSNAGGALLNAALARAQRTCCDAMSEAFLASPKPETYEPTFIEMFLREWQAQRGAGRPRSLYIVDDAPAAQYLAPEFTLFQRLFERAGIESRIADPAELHWKDGCLWHDRIPIDMVYNRLTDFYLLEPRHAALREAYAAGAVVLTPHPRAHALHADKRNLVALSDSSLLRQWAVPDADIDLLKQVIPVTRAVTPENADELWAQRRTLFFKPATGFGARAAYRGDKLTRRVWAEICAGNYVAQALVPPAERAVEVDGAPTDLKFDLRAYAYHGQVQLLAARMYSGQTTNFRTPGGGFAPVYVAS